MAKKPKWTHTLHLSTRLEDDAGARCKDCWWGAAGPWAHLASAEHTQMTGHQRFKFRGIEPAMIKNDVA